MKTTLFPANLPTSKWVNFDAEGFSSPVSSVIYGAVLDILFEQEIPPVGVELMGIGDVFSHDHKVVLEEKLYER